MRIYNNNSSYDTLMTNSQSPLERPTHIKNPNSKGFTLIELMIVVAIIGILTAIAFPSYQEHVRKARRADAQAALQGFALSMERYFTEGTPSTYVGATAASSGAGPGAPISTLYPSEAPLDGASKYYDLTVNSATASAYEVRAAPKNAQAGDDCGTHALKSNGQRGITGGATGTMWQGCWQ